MCDAMRCALFVTAHVLFLSQWTQTTTVCLKLMQWYSFSVSSIRGTEYKTHIHTQTHTHTFICECMRSTIPYISYLQFCFFCSNINFIFPLPPTKLNVQANKQKTTRSPHSHTAKRSRTHTMYNYTILMNTFLWLSVCASYFILCVCVYVPVWLEFFVTEFNCYLFCCFAIFKRFFYDWQWFLAKWYGIHWAEMENARK